MVPMNVHRAIDIDINVANVGITVPDSVAVRIYLQSGLSLVEVDRGRFPQEGDHFRSPGFQSVAHLVDGHRVR